MAVGMDNDRNQAKAEFRRMMTWLAIIGVLMVAGALTYLGMTGDLDRNMVIATTLGVFLSIIVGGGLMAASYFSDKSGHDQSIDDSTRTYRSEKHD